MLDCTCPDAIAPHAAAQNAAALQALCARHAGVEALRRAITQDFPGRIAVVSSFGAESAVLLALVAEIDPATPVLFVDTKQHFPETLAYRDELVRSLGLLDVRSVGPSAAELEDADPPGELWRYDPDACCRLRKVTPLERALAPFAAWVTGRKRHQTLTRSALAVTEFVDGKTKINPLAAWTAEDIEAEMVLRDLPRHALATAGYPSIGCATCTRAVASGEDPRSGRWFGTGKVECGIHRLPEAVE